MVFRHEPPPTAEKQINPVVDVQETKPHVQAASFALDPSRMAQILENAEVLH
jgi:hypothetical protein